MGTIQQAVPVGNPSDNVRAFQLTLDFTKGSSVSFTQAIDALKLDNILSVFIDNSNSGSSTTIIVPGTLQKITAPPYSQGFYPFIFAPPNLNITAISAGNVAVPVQFFNKAYEPFNWSVSQPGAITGTVQVAGTVATQPVPVTATDRSNSSTAANTSKQLMAANGARKRFIIKNPASYTGQGLSQANGAESLFFNFGPSQVNDGVSFELQPGESFDSGAGPCSTDAIYFSSASAGHNVIAKEF